MPLTSPRSIIAVWLFVCTVYLPSAAQTFKLSGNVFDSATHQQCPGATIRLNGTNTGTISNRNGNYAISLAKGEHELTISLLGYYSQTYHFTLDSNTTKDFYLAVNPVALSEVTVYAKNAEAIIRQAIAEKKKMRATLHSYQCNAYAKLTVSSNANNMFTGARNNSVDVTIGGGSSDTTAIGGIMETYTTKYWRDGDGERTIVTQRRQTADIPAEANDIRSLDVFDLNDDEQNLGKYVITGPTAPDALDWYNYELLDVTTLNGKRVYRLRMTPKSQVAALWDGIVSIADSTWDVVQVDVHPNEAVNFPILDSLRYSQLFSLIHDKYWLPSDITLNAYLKAELLIVPTIRIGIGSASVLYDYKVNQPIPDSIFAKSELVIDSSAKKFDSSYWREHEVLPLTGEEQQAYHTIDSVVKHPDTTRSTGGGLGDFLGTFIGAPVKFGIGLYKFNRVEGNALDYTLNVPWHSILPSTSLIGDVGYGFTDKKGKWSATLSQNIYAGNDWNVWAGVSLYNHLSHREDAGYYPVWLNTLFALAGKTDYFNYFYARGGDASVSVEHGSLSLSAAYENENEVSTHTITGVSILFPHVAYRLNPEIADGTMRLAKFTLAGGNNDPYAEDESDAGFSIENETSDASMLKSDFTFARWSVVTPVRLRTSSFGFLDARLQAGVATGALPPQMLFDPETALSFIGPFGVFRSMGIKEFSGDRLLSLYAQEDLGDAIFRLTGFPLLSKSGTDLIIEGGGAWTDMSAQSLALSPMPVETAKRVYWEAGFGISKLPTLPLSFFRLDFTWRLTHLYGSGNFAFTVSTSTAVF